MFQIKNFDSIVASCISNMTSLTEELTDFNVGSKVRTMIEAVAREIDQFYQSLLIGLYESIPVAIYKGFSFGRLSATATTGYVTFTRQDGFTGDITIPITTRVRAPESGKEYTVTANTILDSDEDTVDVLVAATTAGTEWNIGANTITELVDVIDGIDSITNTASLSTGTDEETDQDRKIRFQAWVNSLARSTRSALYYGAMNSKVIDTNGLVTERVVKALVHEPCIDEDPPGDPGYVQVCIWNGSNGASAELIEDTTDIINGYTEPDGTKIAGWKGAGIIVDVFEVAATEVNIIATLTMDTNYKVASVQSTVESLLDTYFGSLEIGETVRRSKIIDLVMGITGVLDITITTPAANVEPDWDSICTRGDVTLS